MTTEQDAHDAAIERMMRPLATYTDHVYHHCAAVGGDCDEAEPLFAAFESAIRDELKEAAAQGRRAALEQVESWGCPSGCHCEEIATLKAEASRMEEQG